MTCVFSILRPSYSMTDPILISGILLLGLLFKFAGFAVRDELWLRILVISGLCCDAIFYAVRSEPVPQSVAANLLLVSINLCLVLLIVTERTTWRMSADDRTLYQAFPRSRRASSAASSGSCAARPWRPARR
jgi:hypothetical protein